LPETESSSVGWADLAVIPIIAILSVPPLLWFGHHPWTIIHTDAPRYLLAASELVSGVGFERTDGISKYNGGHGAGFPAVIGSLILLFGRDTVELAWAMRLMALFNPLLVYFLAKRLSSPLAGLLAAALIILFGFNVESTNAFNIDSVLLTFYLLALLALLAAIMRGSAALAFLSGLLLGTAILTKETAFANFPLALLAVLLLGWDLRGALWHYLGVALVCLPWWIWAWSAIGVVYLIDRLPVPLQVPVLVAAAIVLGFAALAYTSGMVDRFLAEERWRRWVGRFVVGAWTASLTVLVLATGRHKLATVSFEGLRHYLAGLLAPTTIVVPMLVVVGGYVIWKALRRNGAWKVLSLALLFQVPVCLLVTVEGWAPRQFLVAQTLVFCALGALVVDALTVAVGEAASPESGYLVRLAGLVVAVLLVVLLLVLSVERAQALLPENFAGLSKQHRVAPQATEMVDWIAENIPEGERVLVNAQQGGYLAYLDAGRHEWTVLRLDQGICVPRPNTQIRCDPDENAISRIPPDAVWVQMIGKCKVVSLSMPNLLKQVRQSGSDYVMITGSPVFPGILGLPALLQESGAFEVVHVEGRSGAQGVVLLKSTGRAPEAVPTLMNRNAVTNLSHCEQAKGQGFSNWLRSKFPSGILKVTVSD
jgi:4-amino-4-deoxy-L-arabinose transferase-like glycosyltransferase